MLVSDWEEGGSVSAAGEVAGYREEGGSVSAAEEVAGSQSAECSGPSSGMVGWLNDLLECDLW